MSNIEFDKDSYIDSIDRQNHVHKPSKMSLFLIKIGVVKDVKSAQKFFVYLSAVFLIITVYIFTFYVFDIKNPLSLQKKVPLPTPNTLLQAAQMQAKK